MYVHIHTRERLIKQLVENMYVTRPLSLYRRSPECLTEPPPEGPNSGYLVLLDEEAETTCCFGLCKACYIRDLPFPQNKDLTITYQEGEHYHANYEVLFIPVLNQPLSSKQYYVIRRKGKHKGKACTNSKEEDKSNCCCFPCVKDVKPRALEPTDTYQQVEISHSKCWGFSAKSVAPDGIPPYYLRRICWDVCKGTPKNYQLNEAAGLNSSLRNRLPHFNFSLLGSESSSEPVVVGKWYCPFAFVHEEEMELKDQMKRSTFYEVILEQRWDKIFACDNTEMTKTEVGFVDVIVQKEEVFIGGLVGDGKNVISNGVMWFTPGSDGEGKEKRVGLSMLVVERMKWEEERVGWKAGGEGQVRLKSAVEFEGIDEYWTKFGCFVLVERFVFKRMDGSTVLTYDFKHTHQIRFKWE
ncbi:uncharacterized protein LOC125418754 [Ziziphus jujuba]|uniref:Uncharacterized protein LOC125418754 n=2 Tax=Ziziphus jujuba TaxID=326968 RepID=A0ABM3I291_ZIZJJ|nr:uncharacterized protein LOC125418754 [Ziziphus jujuba]